MRRSYFIFALVVVHWLTVLLGPPVQARVVGLVFDDSGSMKNSIHLPTFGAQLLTATLDGREGKDRLFTARLSQLFRSFPEDYAWADGNKWYRPRLPFGHGEVGPHNIDKLGDTASRPLFTEEDIRGRARLEQTIEGMREQWPEENVYTPYEPVEVMLNVLAKNTRPDEEAYLIIISDGAFYDGEAGMTPSTKQLRASYEEYRRRIRGNLKVFFVLILNAESPKDRSILAETVRRQGVRASLLEVFNGAPDVGAYEVDGFDSLNAAMLEIIARVSASDQDRAGTVARRDGKVIELDIPFPITRLISLSVVEDGSPLPRLRDIDFDVADRLDFLPMMRVGDNPDGKIPDWPKTRLLGSITQLLMDPPLAPGSYFLKYDQPVDEDVVLLFRSDVTLVWQLVDADGSVVANSENPDNVVEASTDHPYTIYLQIIDRAGDVVVDPRGLPPDSVFTSSLFGPDGVRNSTLAADTHNARVVGELRFENEGEYEIVTSMRLPGFVTSRSAPLNVRVTDRAVQFAVEVDPVEHCLEPCPAGVVPLTLTSVAEQQPIARIRVTVTSRGSGLYALVADDLPEGLAIVGPDGQPNDTGKVQAFDPGSEHTFTLMRSNAWSSTAERANFRPVTTTLVWKAVQPYVGEYLTKLEFRTEVPNAELVFRGHTQDPTGDEPLVMELADLPAAEYGFDFFLRNAFRLPSKDAFQVHLDWPLSWFLVPEIEVSRPEDGKIDGYGIAVFPKASASCLCFIFDTRVPMTLSYLDPRSGHISSAQAELVLQDNQTAQLNSCIRAFLYLLLALYLFSVLVVFLLAKRFPGRSRLAIEEQGSDYPRLARLRGRNFTLFKSLFWFISGVPHERARREDLMFTARSHGAYVSARGSSWPRFRLKRLGSMLAEIAKKRTEIPLVWGDVLEEQESQPRILTLLRDFRQHGEATSEFRRRREGRASPRTA